MTLDPFVSIVTPVYNGEVFLAECIESVLDQDYANWDYVIVNNCSTDRTLEVAERYAKLDHRIRVITNKSFVDCIGNYNNAFRQASPRSDYCKAVSADDRLLPHCLSKMVRFAVQNPSAGIVGSYQQSDQVIKWTGLPEHVTVLCGREACRLGLLREVHVFGNPTSVLYRSDLIRGTPSFFPHSDPHADTSACYEYLRDCDFGFIHEVLSVERVHDGQVTKGVERVGGSALAIIETLHRYGPLYLSESELARRREEVLAAYYQVLGRCVLKMKRREFWEFQKAGLKLLGCSLDRRQVFIEAIREVVSELRTPLTALRKFGSTLQERTRS